MTDLITRLEEAADMKCPKCNARSGDDWEQCKGSCPLPGSPYFESQPQGQAMTDTVHETDPAHEGGVVTGLWAVGSWLSAALDDPKVCAEMKRDIQEWFDGNGHLRLAASPPAPPSAEPQWITHDGGPNPFDDDRLVECRFDDGSQDVNEASIWDWTSKRAPIIAYRVTEGVKP